MHRTVIPALEKLRQGYQHNFKACCTTSHKTTIKQLPVFVNKECLTIMKFSTLVGAS